MRTSPTYLVLAVALLASPAVIGQMVVVPNGLDTTEANSENAFPFHCKPSSYPSGMRYQQVYSGAEIGAGLIGELRLRQDQVAATWTTTLSGVSITLSSTAAAPDGLSSTFADNLSGDATEVFSGTLVLSNFASTASPAPFRIVLPLRRSFPFNPAGGTNLLLDVTIPTCVDAAPTFDVQAETDGVSRLYGSALSSAGSFTDSLGLVTEFHFHVFADGFESGNTSAWSGATP